MEKKNLKVSECGGGEILSTKCGNLFYFLRLCQNVEKKVSVVHFEIDFVTFFFVLFNLQKYFVIKTDALISFFVFFFSFSCFIM